MKLPIYLDYSATTPVDPRVAEKMMQYLTLDGIFGNPASRSHRYGWQAEEAVDIARNYIAALVGTDSREIIFTSGATESDNLALKGAAYANRAQGNHIITALTEHKSVIDTCQYLEKEGFMVTWLVPLANGIVTPQQLSNAIRDDTILVSLMHVNNETGVIQDIAAFGKLCRASGALFHVDASQSVGKLPINLATLPVDFMSFSSHKVYGPKGIGALFVRRKPWVRINAQIHGGGQELGLRSGTLPVHQIVGMGEAYNIAAQVIANEMPFLRALRDQLYHGLQHNIDGVNVNGDLQQGVATILNISLRDMESDSLMIALKDLAVSTGSACTSAHLEPSHVLRAMKLYNVDNVLTNNSIRFSLGRFTTQEEIDYTIKHTRTVITQLRKQKNLVDAVFSRTI
ncbi:Cysteine desulfurase [Candidatus Moranella endobia PCVAL]|uniref:cysteine desulfurase n=1 Tax=Moranella endobia (strain PCIT) TaxID=903503 RepID=F7XXS5_MOREP|nr:IscS subfamily cysteine desulfurase [Candidatus Moranella endobia]AEI74901.1 cysteine desulfurase IscS [Candidatus Moranella endobia PCIT]AGJ61148.1 Cysteine desulfurase [Candidatus Moranella endobia PCVAL]